MLLQFEVGNFRSIKSIQALTLFHDKSEAGIDTNHFKAPKVMTQMAILGPNNSGKSNLIKALLEARHIVKHSYRYQVDKEFSIEPYLLDKTSASEPTFFKFTLLENDNFYEYEFSATKSAIVTEKLFVTPQNGKMQKWIIRESDNSEDWYINPKLKGRREDWKLETKSNTLLVSLIANLKNQEDIQELFLSITNLKVISNLDKLPHEYTASCTLKSKEHNEKIINFLKGADLGIEGIHATEENFNESMLPPDMPDNLRQIIISKSQDSKFYHSFVVKKAEDGSTIEFELESSESLGTQTMFKLAGPIVDILIHGYTLIVDEIDRSLHTKELQYICSIFASEKLNPNHAQLIFTTHDANIMGDLKRDEIYLAEKADGFSSTFTIMTDKENRNNVPLDKRYLDGQYDALPKTKI